MNSEDGQVYSVCILQFSCFTKYTTVFIQNINKQNVNIADETLTDYGFLSMYHYTKSKNYLKRRYRIRHWFPMFIGTPCRMNFMVRIKVFWCGLDTEQNSWNLFWKLKFILWDKHRNFKIPLLVSWSPTGFKHKYVNSVIYIRTSYRPYRYIWRKVFAL